MTREGQLHRDDARGPRPTPWPNVTGDVAGPLQEHHHLDHGELTPGEDQGVDLRHLAKPGECDRDALRCQVLSGEPRGGQESTRAGALGHTSEMLFTVEVDASALVVKRLLAHGLLTIIPRGEAEVEDAHRGRHRFDGKVAEVTEKGRLHRRGAVGEGVRGLDCHHRKAQSSLVVTGRHEDVNGVGTNRLCRKGGAAVARRDLRGGGETGLIAGGRPIPRSEELGWDHRRGATGCPPGRRKPGPRPERRADAREARRRTRT